MTNKEATGRLRVGINGEREKIKFNKPFFPKQDNEQLEKDIEVYEKAEEQWWVVCSERLPEHDGKYLVTFENGNVCAVGYGCCRRTVTLEPIGFGWYDLHEAIYFDSKAIVAWMPLPEPYKAKEDEA